MAKATETKSKRPRRRTPRKRSPKSAGLEPRDCRVEISDQLVPVAGRVEQEEGVILTAYRDPLGGHQLLLTVLPIDRIQPTPFQRDLSEAHHKRLADVISKTGRFLDPVIAVPAPSEGFWTCARRHCRR